MIDQQELRDCYVPTPTKIVMLVVDGLGGLAHPDTGLSELETAHTPNLDAMAKESACGLTTPVLPGVAPGSGPGHLALFGYDPLKHQIGRGVLEALGIDITLQPGDVAARGNFCTVDGDGLLVDRRAGRIPTELSAPALRTVGPHRGGRRGVAYLPGAGLPVRAAPAGRRAFGTGLRDRPPSHRGRRPACTRAFTRGGEDCCFGERVC